MSDVSSGFGWWQASDGRWYPPVAQPGPGPEAVQPLLTGEPSPTVEPASPGSPPRSPLDTFVLLILVAATLRMVASVASGIIGWGAVGTGTTPGQRLGTALDWGAGFADGQGMVLLAVVLGFLWWRVSGLGRQHPSTVSPVELARTRTFLGWIAVLFVLAALGAAVGIGGTVFSYAGSESQQLVWQRYVGSGGFDVSYLLVALAGVYAAGRLLDGLSAVRDRAGATEHRPHIP